MPNQEVGKTPQEMIFKVRPGGKERMSQKRGEKYVPNRGMSVPRVGVQAEQGACSRSMSSPRHCTFSAPGQQMLPPQITTYKTTRGSFFGLKYLWNHMNAWKRILHSHFTQTKAECRLHSCPSHWFVQTAQQFYMCSKEAFLIGNNPHQSKHPMMINRCNYNWLLWEQAAGLEQMQGESSAAKDRCRDGCRRLLSLQVRARALTAPPLTSWVTADTLVTALGLSSLVCKWGKE